MQKSARSVEISTPIHGCLLSMFTLYQHHHSSLCHMRQQSKKNTKDKYTIKTYKNRELHNRQQENTIQQYTEKQKSVNSAQVIRL